MELSHCLASGELGWRWDSTLNAESTQKQLLPEMVLTVRALNTATCEPFKICHTQDVVVPPLY